MFAASRAGLGSAVHRDRHVCLGEGRRVVGPVAGHGDHVALVPGSRGSAGSLSSGFASARVVVHTRLCRDGGGGGAGYRR